MLVVRVNEPVMFFAERAGMAHALQRVHVSETWSLWFLRPTRICLFVSRLLIVLCVET
jgi:hypothetical protein